LEEGFMMYRFKFCSFWTKKVT